MAFYVGDKKITKMYLDDKEIKKAYLVGTLVFGARKPSRLPAGYTEVEYIQSNGNQYINTGIKPGEMTKLNMDVETLSAGGSSVKYFVYSYYYGNGQRYYNLTARWSNSGVTASMGYASGLNFKVISSSSKARRMTLKFDRDAQTVQVDDENAVDFANSSTYASMPNITLLGYESSTRISAKLYSCKMELNGEPVKDFVPCTNLSGEAGLYDLVSGAFYGETGTGSFTAGPAV